MSREVLSRPSSPPDHTLVYGPDPDQLIDLWSPKRDRLAAPLIVIIHGGFWMAQYDRTHSRPMANALAAEGYAVAVPEYRRVGSPGRGGWPGTFDDIAALIDSVGRLAAPHGADPDRTVWVGHSAGGHLALWAAARHRLPPGSPWRAAGPPAAGVVSLAGCSSLRLSAQWGEGDGAAARLLGGTPDEVPERYAAADPAALLPLGVPVTLVHGTRDEQVRVEMSREYAARATAAGDQVSMVELPGVEHFGLIDPLCAAWPHVLQAIAAAVPTGPSGAAHEA
jgi:acetyl esterase/lipase